jgi:tetratricopeptide (TPR) repeat protein
MRACDTRSVLRWCGYAELHRAAELDPGQARYAYVYAVALHSSGRIAEAMTELKENLERHPNDRETLLALVSFSRDSGDARAALEYAERLAGIAPQDSALAALIEELRRLAGKQTPKWFPQPWLTGISAFGNEGVTIWSLVALVLAGR